MDWIELKRLVTTLILPLPFGLGLVFAGALLRWLIGLRRLGGLLAVAGILVVWVASLPLVAQDLMGRLEAPYPPMAAADCPAAGAIVVLGGAVKPTMDRDVSPRLHSGSDRVWVAARLYHAGPGRRAMPIPSAWTRRGAAGCWTQRPCGRRSWPTWPGGRAGGPWPPDFTAGSPRARPTLPAVSPPGMGSTPSPSPAASFRTRPSSRPSPATCADKA